MGEAARVERQRVVDSLSEAAATVVDSAMEGSTEGRAAIATTVVRAWAAAV